MLRHRVLRIIGYLDLPKEGLDLPYQIFVFADGDKPIASTLKIVFSNMGWVETFRQWKEDKLGLDRDDQWNSEIALFGTRPFYCSWPDNKEGCEASVLPRGFLKLSIEKIMVDKIMDKILGSTFDRSSSRRGNKLFNFELRNIKLTWARSPPGLILAGGGWECVDERSNLHVCALLIRTAEACRTFA